MKKLFIKSYGCQMNVYDSARMADLLAPLGYESADAPDGADMVILNTCHIRERASEKLYSDLGRLRGLKAKRAGEGARMLIAVAGCVAQAEGAEIVAREPAVDMVVGPQSYHRLPEMIARVSRGAGAALETDFPALEKFDALPEASGPQGVSAFLTVQEGCDKFCTFCVVPYTRGAEFSRPVADIEREARHLVEHGAREITLLGQNVNAYRGAGPDGEAWSLAQLIGQLTRIGDLWRIRYVTSHPRDMGDDLIAAHADEQKLMPYLHLPVQSGSDRILAAMNRGHTRDEYLRLIDRIRTAQPSIALSSDFIVGFPAETEGDFESTLALARAVGYAQAFSFKYSPRPGTPGAAMAKQVRDAVKGERLARLQDVLNEGQARFARSCLDLTMPVLFEKPGTKPGQGVGRSPYLQPVHVDGAAHAIGEMHEVRISEVLRNSLRGEFAYAPAREAALTN